MRKWAVLKGRRVGSGTTARRRKAFPTLSYLKSGLSRGSSRRLADHTGDFSLAALSTRGGSVAQPSASLALTKWSPSCTWHRHHLFIRARFPLQAERRRLARPMLMSESRSLSLLRPTFPSLYLARLLLRPHSHSWKSRAELPLSRALAFGFLIPRALRSASLCSARARSSEELARRECAGGA